MGSTIRKIVRIWQIVYLKQLVKRWKAMISLNHATLSLSSTKTHHSNIPLGFFAVYVGSERQRFLIPTRFLRLPIFCNLLKKAEEEYGFKFSGGIVLPCEVEFFRQLLISLEKDEKKFGRFEFDDLLAMFSEVGCDSSCNPGDYKSSPFSPLLKNTRV